jgi:alpha-beta hydrolase superfamily lysophospholipase
MQQTKTKKFRLYLKWVLWVLLFQFVLGNICAAIYAYKFTHFYKSPPSWDVAHPKNIFDKTWKLFKGPSFGKDANEALPRFPYQQLRLERSDRLKINIWYSPVANAKGTICLFHGLNSNKAYYLKEASTFRNYGFTVLLLDFHGHGKSDGMTTTIGYDEAEEVKLAYDYLASKGEKNIYLFGGSMGAVAIARAVAVYHLSPSGIILDMPFDGLLDHIKARGRSFGFPQNLFALPVTCWIGLESFIPTFKHKTSNYARSIHCPVLLEWGTADHLVTRKETESIFNAITSKKKRLVIYEDGVHSSLLSQDPLKWEKEMQEFLNLH